MKRRRLLAGAALAACGPSFAHPPAPRTPAQSMDAVMWNRGPIGGPFTLVDHMGRRRTERDWRGRFVLVYFGYTSCADVCPTDLHEIGLALDQLGPLAAQVQALFITLDPERDTVHKMRTYVGAMHPALVGLTGSPAAIHAVADVFRMGYRKVPGPGGDYGIDHAAFTYTLDREGRYVGFFPPGTGAARYVQVLRERLAAH